jgi:hypothetical protein
MESKDHLCQEPKTWGSPKMGTWPIGHLETAGAHTAPEPLNCLYRRGSVWWKTNEMKRWLLSLEHTS